MKPKEGEEVELRILGHRLTIKDDAGAPIDISRGQVRELLCVLAIEPGSVVSTAALVERLWDPGDGDRTKSLKQAVYNARLLLTKDRLRTKDGGYHFHLAGTDYLDLVEFQRLTDQARAVRNGAPQAAVDLYQRALDLWGTPPLGDLPKTISVEPFRQSLLGGLLDAREELAEALLQLHEFRKLINSATRWLADDPFNEHLRGLLMLALTGADRKGEALRSYREAIALLEPDARPGGWLEGVAAQITDNRDDVGWSPRPVWLASDARRLNGTGIDTTLPSPARVYDCLLGGKDNFAVDRDAAAALLKDHPPSAQTARVHRAFVIRAVRYLVEQQGVRQFIDIGAGLPSTVNVHDVVQREAPGAPVVYVDNDPLVCTYGRALLAKAQGVAIIEADVRDPQEILEHPTTRQLIDFDQPLAILMATVVHYIPDHDDPQAIVRAYVQALPPGGYLALSHCTIPAGFPMDVARRQIKADRWGGSGLHPREHGEVVRFFEGLTLVEPGRLVDAADWRPDLATGKVEEGLRSFWVGVGRKGRPLTGA